MKTRVLLLSPIMFGTIYYFSFFFVHNGGTHVPTLFMLPPGKMAKADGYNNYWLVLSKRRKIAFTIIPKVMCTTIRSVLAKFDCNNQVFGCSEARWNIPLQQEDITNYTRVLMVRDPFERLYSAYLNSDHNSWISLQTCKNTTQCSFPEWVDEMSGNTELAFQNEHFTPQSQIAQLHLMHYHYYFRISSGQDQKFLWGEIFKVSKSHENFSNKNHPYESSYKSLPITTVEKIARMYDNDLKLWKDVLAKGSDRHFHERTVYDWYLETLND